MTVREVLSKLNAFVRECPDSMGLEVVGVHGLPGQEFKVFVCGGCLDGEHVEEWVQLYVEEVEAEG